MECKKRNRIHKERIKKGGTAPSRGDNCPLLVSKCPFQVMFGYSNDEIRGRNINDIIVPPPAREEAGALSSLSQHGTTVSKETTRRRKDGTSVDVHITGYPILIEGRHVGVYGMYENISERKALEAQIFQAQKMESIGTLAGRKATDVPAGTETILIVEDEEALRGLVRMSLETAGYRVLSESDGQAALEAFKSHRNEIALVISDVGLPKICGDQLFLAMKQLSPGVKTILASGYIEPEMRTDVLHAGVKAFLQKPYDIRTVLAEVRRILDAR